MHIFLITFTFPTTGGNISMASIELSALPVKRMVLYKHGVGYIERTGKIKNKKEIKLSFKKELMNDILKSLLIFSKGTGKVTGVSYETPEDISKLQEKEDEAIYVVVDPINATSQTITEFSHASIRGPLKGGARFLQSALGGVRDSVSSVSSGTKEAVQQETSIDGAKKAVTSIGKGTAKGLKEGVEGTVKGVVGAAEEVMLELTTAGAASTDHYLRAFKSDKTVLPEFKEQKRKWKGKKEN